MQAVVACLSDRAPGGGSGASCWRPSGCSVAGVEVRHSGQRRRGAVGPTAVRVLGVGPAAALASRTPLRRRWRKRREALRPEVALAWRTPSGLRWCSCRGHPYRGGEAGVENADRAAAGWGQERPRGGGDNVGGRDLGCGGGGR